MKTESKIIRSSAALRRVVAELRKNRKKIVFTNGCFDLIHTGHISILEQARALGRALIVGINSDGSVRRLKGPLRPVLPMAQRARVLAALSAVDYVAPFTEDTPARLIAQIRPDILVKGADWNAGEIAGREFAKRVVRFRLVPGISTTAIIKKILLEGGGSREMGDAG